MKSIKTNPNSAKEPDKGKIVNKLYCILLTTLVYSFFQEKMLGDISFKLETKIMNFMSVFFEKKYNQAAQVLSIICNTICLQL
jgi:hypothetical protein